jgi:Na+-transporting NADH:ubiquinone oxidoreductase subunit F
MILLSAQTTVIITSVIVFLGVIILLVSVLLFAKKKLTPSGIVKVSINEGDLEIDTEPGNTLLSTLGNNKILLPSACGGGGTCAMCRCQVEDGGGSILPTETGFFTRKEQNENWRLACQVKVKEDMQIKIPQEVLGVKKWECEVVSNNNVATFIKEFVVRLPEGENLDFKSGGYIQIDVPKVTVNFKDFDIRPLPDDPAGDDKFRSEWDKFQLWDLQMKNDEPQFRAYSMANHPAEGNIIKLNIRIATPPWDRNANGGKGGWMDVNPGVCSSYVFNQKPGDKVTISGPYGEFFIKDTKREMLYIGGGAGMAPLRSHLFHLFHTEKTRDRKVTYWYGGRSLRELFYTNDFREIEQEFDNFKYNIALSNPLPEDNWDGYTGFIHQVVYENYLSKHPEPEEIEYYLCGPPLMLQACLKMFDDLGVPEENIAFDDFGS